MTSDQIPIPVLTPSQAKELGTWPVSEGPLKEVEASIRATVDYVDRLPDDALRALPPEVREAFHLIASNELQSVLSMARQSLGGGSGWRDLAEEAQALLDESVASKTERERTYYEQSFVSAAERLVKAVLSAPAVTAPPKREEEPSDEAKLLAYEHAHETAIELGYPSITEALEAARPNPVSAELVEAGKAVEAAITAFANMALLAVPADHNPTVRAVLGEGLYNARERLRAALSAHAGEG